MGFGSTGAMQLRRRGDDVLGGVRKNVTLITYHPPVTAD
jgi:hypothetical protein